MLAHLLSPLAEPAAPPPSKPAPKESAAPPATLPDGYSCIKLINAEPCVLELCLEVGRLLRPALFST